MLGIKNSQNFQHYRLPRYSTDGLSETRIEMKLPNIAQLITAKPINFSKYGLAFSLSDKASTQIQPNMGIDLLRFSAYGQTFYEGPVTIRHSQFKNGECEVGVFTGKNSINVEEILGSQMGNQIIEGKNGFSHIAKSVKISEEFQLLVAQYRDFLNEFKESLSKAEEETIGFSEEEKEKINYKILILLDPYFKEKTDKYMVQVSQICSELKEEELIVYKMYFQNHLQDLLLVAPMPKRSVEKPLGYSGDYEMMNMIYDRNFEGDSLYSKLQNRYWCSIPPARANILRLHYFKNKIAEVVAETLRFRDEVKITSLGSGPAKEIAEFVRENPLSNHCTFTCVDQEPKALEYSQQVLTEVARSKNRNVQFNFVLANVVSYLRSNPQQYMYEQDLFFASGLFDYLKQSVAKKLIEILFGLIKPKSELIIVNASSENPGRIGMEFAGEWYLNYRIKEEMIDLASGLEGCQRKELFLDEEKVYWYLSLKK